MKIGGNKTIKQYNKSGFTLVELLVVGAIIIILTAIVVPNYRNADQKYALDTAANQLVQNIRQLQEMALGAAVVNGTVPPRYGIYFPGAGTNYYIMFSDLNNDGKFYTPNDPTKDYIIPNGTSNYYYYGSGITLSNITWDPTYCVPQGPKRVHITFSPPDPTTDIWIGKSDGSNGPQAVECQNVALTLSDSSSGLTKQISVNMTGLVAMGQVASPVGTLLTAPSMSNGVGATNLTQRSAQLNGQVVSNGGSDTLAKIYWGTSDGKTSTANWDHVVSLGLQTGAFSTALNGSLNPDSTYYYRVFGLNSQGSSWAPETIMFKTGTTTETIRPTNFYDPRAETFQGPSAYDTDPNTKSSTLYAYNRTVNFGTTWQTKTYIWSSAILYATIERQAAIDDQAAVEIRNSAGTLIYTLMPMASTNFAKQTISVPLNSFDWGGTGFPNISDLRLNIRDSKSKQTDGANVYIYDIKIVGQVPNF